MIKFRPISVYYQIATQASTGARISMDVEAGAPIIMIPMSSKSNDILVANLGTLSIHNQFLRDGDDGTQSAVQQREIDAKLAESRKNKPPNQNQVEN